MFGSVVLDTAIGLSLLFLFVSLICSAIREAIEAVMNLRAGGLEQGVRTLMDDPTGEGATRALYAHPLIFSLYPGQYDPSRLRPKGGRPGAELWMPLRDRIRLPAYIPSSSFARAFLDLVLRGPVGNAGRDVPVLSIETIGLAAQEMPDGRVRRALLAALDEADGDLHRVQHALEAWFETAMARVSGWYKRRTQIVLFGIGVAVAAAMNIDAFSVGRALMMDKSLRDGAVAQASSYLEHQDGVTPDMARASFFLLEQDLAAIPFPTGWEPAPQHLRLQGRLDPGALMQMLFGWLVTGFAVMLGAPFWFDLLGRFMIVRATVKPPGAGIAGRGA